MAYQAFYNKYRPQTFQEVVGQQSIVKTLENAIREDKIAHAYLFCGPRGTGKTTMARLFAKALDCEKGLGEQCNECASCKAIMQGDHPDVIEIDAASNSSVDSVRQLIDNVSYQPIMSRYKVYIIDEVHNMSNAAFNALLKTLEEPPSFVVFILATTEPNKIIPTILSRVQRFDFSKVSDPDLIRNMEHILKEEKVDYEPSALQAIASLSDGGVRDSLSLLDKLVSYASGKLTEEDVNTLFGLLSVNDEIRIVRLLDEGKTDELIKMVREKYSQGMDIVRLHQDLITIYKDLILYQTTKDETLLSKLSKETCESTDLPLSRMEKTIRILVETKRGYRTAENALSHLELSLLRVILEKDQATGNSSSQAPSYPVTAKASVPEKAKPAQEKVLASEAVPVESKSQGFESSPKKENKTLEEDRILYTEDDLVNLMKLAVDKEKVKVRKEITASWNRMEGKITPDQYALGRDLLASKPILLAEDILVVDNEMPVARNNINRQSSVKVFREITKNAFGTAYRILAISKEELGKAFVAFKKVKDTPAEAIRINFGKEEKKESSTDFFNDLMAHKDDKKED